MTLGVLNDVNVYTVNMYAISQSFFVELSAQSFVKIRKLPSPMDDLCHVWLEFACGSEEKDF